MTKHFTLYLKSKPQKEYIRKMLVSNDITEVVEESPPFLLKFLVGKTYGHYMLGLYSELAASAISNKVAETTHMLLAFFTVYLITIQVL